VLISLWPSSAKGEDYISKNFPSDAILSMGIKLINLDRGTREGKFFFTVILVGKKQNADGDYVVFYAFKDPKGDISKAVRQQRLLKLDTNVWVFYEWEGSSSSYILQK
jgi:hypothetical protein